VKRNLYRRLDQLAARLASAGEPLIINVRFVSAVDKSVTRWIPSADRTAWVEEDKQRCIM